MSDREELMALRRMAELESRAGGGEGGGESARGPLDFVADSANALSQLRLNALAGAVKGASNIGATILRPIDALLDKRDEIEGITGAVGRNETRKIQIQKLLGKVADTDSVAFKGGELGAEIAGTSGVGGAITKILGVAKYAPRLASAIESGGFKLGGPRAATIGEKVADAGIRAAGGGITGAASAGLVNPDEALAGGSVGAALPGAARLAGAAGKRLAGKVSDDVKALYGRAKELGIDIPADRIVNNKPLNALASSLNYVPLSGRAGTEERMVSQVNRALSRTFGQDSENVTGALRKANSELGAKFDDVLTKNKVNVDDDFLNDLVTNMQKATNELDDSGARIIGKQVDEIMNKAVDGQIDGQAAYNIKKTLDRIGSRNSNEAYYARELKKSLMGALNRSLGPEEAKGFAKLRQQYGNMLDLEGLAANGAEGGVSIGKLANMKGINNKELQEIADIAAQFVKPRENPHGAAQRVVLGSIALPAAGATGTLPLLAAGVAGGRLANTALNSSAVKNALLRQSGMSQGATRLLANPVVRNALYQASVSNP